MENVPIHLLNAFVVFAESENLISAAAKLGITQPALSKQLKSLEEKMESALFGFQGRKKILTPFAIELAARLKERLSGLQNVVQQTHLAYKDPQKSSLRIAARRGLLERCMPQLKFSGQLHYIEMGHQEIIPALINREIEMGITHHPPDSLELTAQKVLREEFKIVIPTKWSNTKRLFGPKLLQELQRLPVIAYKKNDEILGNLFSENLCQIYRIISDYSSILNLVQAQMGWAILPSYLDVDPKKAQTVPVPKDLIKHRDFYVIYRKELGKIPWFKELRQELASSFL